MSNKKRSQNRIDIALEKDSHHLLVARLREGGKKLWQIFANLHDVRMNVISGDTALRLEKKSGSADLSAISKEIHAMAEHIENGQPVTEQHIRERATSLQKSFAASTQSSPAKGRGAQVSRSVANFKPLKRQAEYVLAIESHGITFGVGPAGTGKTYAAMATAIKAFEDGKVKRLILVRPAQDAGEKLGYLPGGPSEKVSPFMRPFFDALRDFGYVGPKLQTLIDKEQIEIAPVAFMRGRTLSDAYVLVDEAQNLTTEQMRMLLTRPKNSRVIITGDPSQTDLEGKENGLSYALDVFTQAPKARISIFKFDESDVVRDDLVADVLDAFNAYAQKKAATPTASVTTLPVQHRRAGPQ